MYQNENIRKEKEARIESYSKIFKNNCNFFLGIIKESVEIESHKFELWEIY